MRKNLFLDLFARLSYNKIKNFEPVFETGQWAAIHFAACR